MYSKKKSLKSIHKKDIYSIKNDDKLIVYRRPKYFVLCSMYILFPPLKKKQNMYIFKK